MNLKSKVDIDSITIKDAIGLQFYCFDDRNDVWRVVPGTNSDVFQYENRGGVAPNYTWKNLGINYSVDDLHRKFKDGVFKVVRWKRTHCKDCYDPI